MLSILLATLAAAAATRGESKEAAANHDGMVWIRAEYEFAERGGLASYRIQHSYFAHRRDPAFNAPEEPR